MSQPSRWRWPMGAPQTVIAAVLLLHERSVDEIVPKLRPAELEQVIKLVGRSPSVYPPGTLEALEQRKALVSPELPQRSGESTCSVIAAEKQHAGTPALIPGASRRRLHLRDLTPAPMIGGASSKGVALRTLSGAKPGGRAGCNYLFGEACKPKRLFHPFNEIRLEAKHFVKAIHCLYADVGLEL